MYIYMYTTLSYLCSNYNHETYNIKYKNKISNHIQIQFSCLNKYLANNDLIYIY